MVFPCGGSRATAARATRALEERPVKERAQGGNAAWFAAGLPAESGLARATTAADDVWYKPYDYETDIEKHMQAYLDWEVALVEQIKRDPTIKFRAF